jgi:hypothetical protein
MLSLPIFRLIDIQNECIVIRSVSERYFALSYVWGGVAPLKLTEKNERELMSIRGLSRHKTKIPITVRDAMMLCQTIGEEYLWVDSLCLMQDDPQDLARGIKAMASIYERALVTIIAGSGTDANSGLPGVRMGSRKAAQPMAEVKPGIRMIGTRGIIDHMRRTRYTTRGWT